MTNNHNIIAELTQNNSINLYTITPKQKEIKTYKKRIILNSNIGFSYLKTNNYQVIEKFIKQNEVDFQDISYQRKISQDQNDYGTYFEISEDYLELSPQKKAIVDAYIDGAFASSKPKKLISDNQEVEYPYLIDTSSEIKIIRNTFGTSYQLGINLCLPIELYILQLLEANQILRLKDIKCRKQAELFTITPYKEISLKELQELCELGLVPNSTYKDLLESTKQNSKIVRIMKQKKGN